MLILPSFRWPSCNTVLRIHQLPATWQFAPFSLCLASLLRFAPMSACDLRCLSFLVTFKLSCSFIFLLVSPLHHLEISCSYSARPSLGGWQDSSGDKSCYLLLRLRTWVSSLRPRGRKELIPTTCLPNSTFIPWHTCTHMHTRPHTENIKITNKR